MKFSGPFRSAAPPAILLLAAVLSLFVLGAAHAAMPFSSATVSRVENQVKFGQMKGGQSEMRLATAQDVVKASDFLLSETNSRAELIYPDGSIVRIGQNTIFSFDSNTRTFHLKKGTFVVYVPKGMGGATIKTPSYTAAITGTTLKCSEDRCAVVEGSVTLADGRVVNEGQYFQVEAGGAITIHDFDNTFEGLLMTFNGKIPTDTVVEDYQQITVSLRPQESNLNLNDSVATATNLPDAVVQRTKIPVPKLPKLPDQPDKVDVTVTANPPPPHTY